MVNEWPLKRTNSSFFTVGGFSQAFIWGTIGSYIEVTPEVSTTFHAEHESDEFERMGRTVLETEGNDIPQNALLVRNFKISIFWTWRYFPIKLPYPIPARHTDDVCKWSQLTSTYHSWIRVENWIWPIWSFFAYKRYFKALYSGNHRFLYPNRTRTWYNCHPWTRMC